MSEVPLTSDQAQMMADALDLEQYDVVTIENGVMTHVHREADCLRRGGGCWIHRPTQDWPLAGQPVVYDARSRVAYRRCVHSVLHPDIDAIAFLDSGITRYEGRGIRPGDAAYHPGCDGCCKSPGENQDGTDDAWDEGSEEVEA